MEHLKKASDRFKAAHEEFFRTNPGYAVGYGYDPSKKGAPGVVVFAMPKDSKHSPTMVQEARNSLPATWEGLSVYVDAR